MSKITLSKIIAMSEEINRDYNYKTQKYEQSLKAIPEIPDIVLTELKAQNELLDNLFCEFNIEKNSFVYYFRDSNSNENVKVIDFVDPIHITEATLFVENFIYSKPVRFKVTFHYIDNTSQTVEMLPHDFRGDYIEEIKFNKKQKESLFRCLNSEKLTFFEVISDGNGEERYKKINKNYGRNINEEGFIEFDTNHKLDRLICKYTPISSEFKRNIDNKVTSIVIELDKNISNEIKMNFTK